MDRETARTICGIVAGIAETDGGLHPTEHALLRRVLEKFGLRGQGDETPVPPLDRPQAKKAVAELSDELRSEVLELLIEAAIADHRVVPLEQRFLAEVAALLGVNEQQLEERLVDRMLES